jgi:tetratricopeptide (TPR) repeat protein
LKLIAWAGNEEDIFFEANKHYSEGNYTTAAELYEDIVSRGVESGNLFYNLGNAYFKIGQKGKALLNYERARKLIPNDEDVFANTSFVRTVLDARQPEENYKWYEKLYIIVRDIFGPGAWFINTVILFHIICFFLGVSIFIFSFRKTAYISSAVVGVFFLLSLFFFAKSYYFKKNIERGVVIVPKIEVRYSPSYSGAVAFELTEGIQASILRQEGEWSQIRLNRKSSGWIESQAIEKI